MQPLKDMGSSIALTVVIPAFKDAFLRQALESLARQSNKDFSVVVADDASPADLKSICDDFIGCVNVHYTRFENNLGHADITAHWSRAVALAKTEWVWLMGDDDELEPDCVASVIAAIDSDTTGTHLFHVNVVQIDQEGKAHRAHPEFPERLSARCFAWKRFHYEICSFACEYVFRRERLEALGGFVSFPDAWCSDDATWIRLAGDRGIKTIVGDSNRARWRLSMVNISAQQQFFGSGKTEALLLYLRWMKVTLATLPLAPGEPNNDAMMAAAVRWMLASLINCKVRLSLVEACRLGHRMKSAIGVSAWSSSMRLMMGQRWIE